MPRQRTRLSDKDFKEGQIIKLWEVPEIEIDGEHYKKPKYRKIKKKVKRKIQTEKKHSKQYNLIKFNLIYGIQST